MRKLFVLLLIICLLFSLVSCTEQPDIDSSYESYTSAGLRLPENYKTFAYGNYIYLSGGFNVGLRRYNRTDGELLSACVVPDCTGDCYVERMAEDLAGITEGKLVFSTNPKSTSPQDKAFWAYASYDLVTGEEKLLVAFQMAENFGQAPVLWEGYAYYQKKCLKKGGNASNPNDYEPFLYRVSVHGGDEEVLFPLEKQILPYFIVDGQLYCLNGRDLGKIDLATGEMCTVSEAEAIGYTSIVAQCYYDGYIYCTLSDGSTFTDAQGKSFPVVYIGRFDIATGEMKTLVQYAHAFLVTEKGIYYGKAEETVYLYIPPAEEKEEAQTIYNSMPTLSFCKHDGSEAKDVFRAENLDYSNGLYEVIEDICYISAYEYDAETHAWGTGGLYAVNLTDGTYRKAVVQRNE